MLSFVKALTEKHKAKAEYWDKLKEVLADEKIDEREDKELQKLAQELGLDDKELRELHKKAASLEWASITADHIITDDEKKSLEELLKYFDLRTTDFDFDQKTFNKFYCLGMIEKGILPNIQNHDVDVIFKPSEVLHWACPAALKKYKRVVTRVGYAGPRASIRIAKGLSYRVGSYKVSAQSKEVLITEDTGPFWITNQRIGFTGQRKNFVINLNKILHFELTPYGLVIAKEGRENPYLVQLDDYEVPAAVISHLLNS
ncbi:MAG: hypothetical protein ACREGG_04595 [Candidatus Saccharimonadales bacterium]